MNAPQPPSRNPLLRILYGVIALVVLIYLLWPYATLARLWFALKSEDRPALVKLVDWANVREGLQLDVTRLLKKQASRRLSLGGGQFSVSIEFESTNVSAKLAEKLATPDALILIFNHPQVLPCIGSNIELADAEKIADRCAPKVATPPNSSLERQSAGVEGPNFSPIAEKTSYAFFTGLFTFKLSIAHDGIPIEIRLRRSGLGWKVGRIQASFQKVGNND